MKKLKKKKIDLSVIILNYNSGDFLKNCLRSVLQSEENGFKYEVIVVDNASTDGSLKKIQYSNIQSKLKIKIIKNKKNLGFAAGNNVGIKKAEGRYILFLNPDTLVRENTFKEMIKFMDSYPQAGAATCRVELPDGRLDEACHRGFPTPWNAFCHFSGLEKLFPKSKLFSGYLLGHLSLNKIHEIDSGAGAFLIVRREAGEKINWWDEDYFWYGEDLDFCYRIKQNGWRIYFVPKVKIIHFKGVSSGIKKESAKISKASKKTKIRALKASVAVMRIFYRKHYLNKYPKLINWLVMRGIDLVEKIRLWRI